MIFFQGIVDYINLNRRFYSYSEEDIRKYQLNQLISLVNFVKEKSNFYRKIYNGIDIRTIDDFLRLPTINKEIMMRNFDELNTCNLKLEELMDFALKKEEMGEYSGYFNDEYVVGLSSGTSGNKGIYITPKRLTKRLPFVFLARSGIPLKFLPFRILFLLRVFSQGFKDINSPFVKLKYMSTMSKINDIIYTVNNDRINIIMAPPSMLRILLPYANRIKVKLKIIVTYAEVLYDEDKIRFSEVFGCDIIQIYQASEGPIGSSCRCGNLHINEDLVFVELYDKDGNIIEKPGKIAQKMIITNLINSAQPIIRYEMNDLIILGEKCKCGSNFRKIQKILGRNDDLIYLRNKYGERQYIFPDLFSRWIITTSDNIREFNVIQKGEKLDIILDTFENANKDLIKKELMEKLNRELNKYGIIKVKIKIRFQKIILPENMNKYKRFIISYS